MTNMRRFYNDYMQAKDSTLGRTFNQVGRSIYFINVDFLIPSFPDACSACALPFEDDHGRLIGVAVQADMLNPDYPGDGEPECLNAGIKYFVPDHNRKIMIEVSRRKEEK